MRAREKLIPLTHDELCTRAQRWLTGAHNCGFAFKELTSLAGEIPDAIGFKSNQSILIECKISRSDFLSDKTKVFRRTPHLGMGNYRYYMCMPGMIEPVDLPENWGLLYCHRRKVVVIKKPRWQVPDKGKETMLMYSALRRLHIRGRIDEIYDKSYLCPKTKELIRV